MRYGWRPLRKVRTMSVKTIEEWSRRDVARDGWKLVARDTMRRACDIAKRYGDANMIRIMNVANDATSGMADSLDILISSPSFTSGEYADRSAKLVRYLNAVISDASQCEAELKNRGA